MIPALGGHQQQFAAAEAALGGFGGETARVQAGRKTDIARGLVAEEADERGRRRAAFQVGLQIAEIPAQFGGVVDVAPGDEFAAGRGGGEHRGEIFARAGRQVHLLRQGEHAVIIPAPEGQPYLVETDDLFREEE